MRKDVREKDKKVISNTAKVVLIFVALVMALIVSLSFSSDSVDLQPSPSDVNVSVSGNFGIISFASFLGFFISFIIVLFLAYYFFSHNFS